MRNLFCLVLLFIAACSSTTTKADLSIVCAAFQDLENKADLASMSAESRYAFLNNQIEGKLSVRGGVREIWDVLPTAASDSKYSFFRMAATELLETDWDCEAMRRVAPSLGP